MNRNNRRIMQLIPKAVFRFMYSDYGIKKGIQITVPVYLAIFAFAFPSPAFMLPSPHFFLTTFVAFNFLSSSFMALGIVLSILKTRSALTYEMVSLVPHVYILLNLVISIPFGEEKYKNITTWLQGFIIPTFIFVTHLSSIWVLYWKLKNGIDLMSVHDYVQVHHRRAVRRRF